MEPALQVFQCRDGLWPQAEVSVRRQLYRNLRELAMPRAIEHLPEQLSDLLLVA